MTRASRVNRSLKHPASIGNHGDPQRRYYAANAPSSLHRDPRKSTGAMVKIVVSSTEATHVTTAPLLSHPRRARALRPVAAGHHLLPVPRRQDWRSRHDWRGHKGGDPWRVSPTATYRSAAGESATPRPWGGDERRRQPGCATTAAPAPDDERCTLLCRQEGLTAPQVNMIPSWPRDFKLCVTPATDTHTDPHSPPHRGKKLARTPPPSTGFHGLGCTRGCTGRAGARALGNGGTGRVRRPPTDPGALVWGAPPRTLERPRRKGSTAPPPRATDLHRRYGQNCGRNAAAERSEGLPFLVVGRSIVRLEA